MTAAAKKQNRSDEELAMRALIIPELRKRWPEARVVHELPLRYSERRIDLAAIGEDRIVVVEIKSSKDVADRLEAQLRGFKDVSWKLVAALAPKWNEKLPLVEWSGTGFTSYSRPETACQKIIRQIGSIDIWTVDAAAGLVVDTTTRSDGFENEFPHTAKMLDILWVEELKAIACRHNVFVGKRPTHLDLLRACVDTMTGREIKAAVCRALRARSAFGSGSDPPVVTRAPELV